MKHFFCLSFLLAAACGFAAEPVTPAGEQLNRTLDGMHVLEHWIAGGIVEWRTGDPTGKPVTDSGKHTHCSQFAASACDRMGVYLLRPPDHGSVLLANAQYDWLGSAAGRQGGWKPVVDGVKAQNEANKGLVVVAVYKNKDPKKPGHIAIIRPGTRTEAEIAASGPNVIQAGGHNYESAPLKQGFANHPGGFENHEIKFFEHPQGKAGKS